MADLTQYYTALQKADAAGDTAGAKQLADYIRSQSAPKARSMDVLADGSQVPTAGRVVNPTDEMSGFERFRAGWGRAVSNLELGAAQHPIIANALGAHVPFGMPVDEQTVQNERDLSAPLMNTTAGQWGNIVGTGVTTLPAGLVPGAGGLLAVGAIGAGLGAMQPSTSTGEHIQNTALGGGGAMAGILAGRALGVGYNALRSTAEPFFQGGQERIAARTLQAFAGGDQASAQAATNISSAGSVLPGVQPTTAELANNAGLAQLERQLRNNPQVMTEFAARDAVNRTAVTQGLDSIAGTDAARAAAVTAREAASRPLYQAAAQVSVTPDTVLQGLLKRPAMQSAWAKAQQIAANSGENIGTLDQPTGKAIQYLKMGLSDMVNTGPQQGIGSHEIGAIKSTLGSLTQWIDTNVPALRAADDAFRTGSAPINQMDIGAQLRDKLIPALGDFGNTTRLNSASFANAVRNGDAIAANVTGSARSTLAGTLTPGQMRTVTQVGEQLARRANANEMGRAVGSNTSQNLVSQNLLRQILGPLGLPESMTERVASSTLGESLLRPAQWAASSGEKRIMGVLSEAALDPQKARRILLDKQINGALQKLMWTHQGVLGSTAGSFADSRQ